MTVRYLSKHSEDPRFKEAAEKIYRSLRRVATSEGLLPTLLNVATGEGKGSSYRACGGEMMDRAFARRTSRAWRASQDA